MAYQIQYHDARDGSVEEMVNRRMREWKVVSVAPVVVEDGVIKSYLVTWQTGE